MLDRNISLRVSRIVNLFLCILLLILLRIWYLSVVKYEDYFQQSRKPQRRTIIEPIERATIRDRFNEPLAINQVQYNAAICYADIRQIPTTRWEKDSTGKLKKSLSRRSYIEQFALFLEKELGLSATAIEDIIHGKASLFPHTPFVIKADIDESLYARLKMAEKDWVGLHMQRVSRRIYPQGKCGCNIVGYLGAISQKEYIKIADEIRKLKNYLSEREEGKLVFLPSGYSSPFEVRKRLKELEERAYTINDLVGKSGVEATFDEALRGIYGKKILEVDQKGNCISELPGARPSIEGEKLILSISIELQKTAEELLAQYEFFQDKRDKNKSKERSHSWIRGSSIVAMHPETGEILALASHPRFDPNDFILARDLKYKNEKSSEIRRWLENETHIAEIWDGKYPLSRELFSPDQGTFYEERLPLTWERFLSTILWKEGKVYPAIETVNTIEEALHIQDNPESEDALLTDLLSLAVHPDDIPLSLRQEIGKVSLGDWRFYNQTVCLYRAKLYSLIKEIFHKVDFQDWRSSYFKNFIKIKRTQERKEKRFARPYTDYLELEEHRQFQEFWKANRLLFLHCFVTGISPPSSPLSIYLEEITTLRHSIKDVHLEHLQAFITSLSLSSQLHLLAAWRSFEELNRPLRGSYSLLRKENGVQLQKHLAAAFYPVYGFGYERSQAFRQSTPLGSVFKLMPAYAALCKKFEELKEHVNSLDELSPFTLIDESRRVNSRNLMGYFSSGEPIPGYYKGGRLPRSSASMGSVNLMEAIERSSNLYFSILAGDFLSSSMDLAFYASQFGFGEKTGINLPGEYQGELPLDVAHDKTGLYSLAIGQHSLVVTPLQTAVMFSSIANGGKILKPQIVKLIAGKQRTFEEESLFFQKDFPYKDTLSLIGVTFPLFTQPLTGDEQSYIAYHLPQVKSTVPMPEKVRSFLIEAMRRVTNGARGSARPSIINQLYHNRQALQDYGRISSQLIGKTGTAEILYKDTIDGPPDLEKHVWFAGISFTDSTLQTPELVVVVYLRFGESGKEGAPLAARIVQKWRELLENQQSKEPLSVNF